LRSRSLHFDGREKNNNTIFPFCFSVTTQPKPDISNMNHCVLELACIRASY
jgi:hypothetical protein